MVQSHTAAMRYAILVLFLIGCVGGSDPVETDTGVLITVKPSPKPTVTCSLREDGYTCDCTMSECGRDALRAAAEQCWRLRNPIVVE